MCIGTHSKKESACIKPKVKQYMTQKRRKLLRCAWWEHTCMQCEYRRTQRAGYQRGQSVRQKCNRGGERELWESEKSCDWDGALVIFGSVSTLQSGRRIFPRAARPSDGTQRHRERARECEGAREEVTQHSSPNESTRLLRQLKQDDPPPPPNLLKHPSTPSVLDHWRLHFTPWLALILPKMSLYETLPFLQDKTETHTHTQRP